MNSELFRIQGRRARFGQGLTLAFFVCLLLGVVMAVVLGYQPSVSAASPSAPADPPPPITESPFAPTDPDSPIGERRSSTANGPFSGGIRRTVSARP